MNALVRIGDGVKRLIVAGGLNLSSTVLHSMLLLCPNIQHLDASYTHITDLSFKGCSFKFSYPSTIVVYLIEFGVNDQVGRQERLFSTRVFGLDRMSLHHRCWTRTTRCLFPVKVWRSYLQL